jgi:hypothetical protein
MPIGISIKTFTSESGQTSTTFTTNPDFEAKNGVEIVTKTVKIDGRLETTTTTALIPLVADGRMMNSGKPSGKSKEKEMMLMRGVVIVTVMTRGRYLMKSSDLDLVNFVVSLENVAIFFV